MYFDWILTLVAFEESLVFDVAVCCSAILRGFLLVLPHSSVACYCCCCKRIPSRFAYCCCCSHVPLWPAVAVAVTAFLRGLCIAVAVATFLCGLLLLFSVFRIAVAVAMFLCGPLLMLPRSFAVSVLLLL